MFQRHHDQNQRLMLVTTNTKNRRKVFADPACAREAVEALYFIQGRHPFFLYGFVVMPDHCHLLLYAPEGSEISRIMRDYKRRVAFSIGKGSIWQSRFHILYPEDRSAALSYIHANPVQARLVDQPQKYPWSSASGTWDISSFKLQ
jgi:putative transposase